MSTTRNSIQVEDGVVSTDASNFVQAIERIRRYKLRGLWIRPGGVNTGSGPVIDLSLLKDVTFITDFGISDSVPLQRITGFDSIYQLSKLKKLALHTYKRLDLSHFPKVETLLVTDAPGLANLETLTELRYARISKLRADDVSFLSRMRKLTELWIIKAASKSIRSLDSSPALSTLDISYCSKLESISAIPKSLVTLSISKCARLRDLSFLVGQPSLKSLTVDVMETVAFVPSLRQLSYVAFENVLDGDLEPLVKSKSLRDVAFYPEQRKHYTHSLTELKKILAAQR